MDKNLLIDNSKLKEQDEDKQTFMPENNTSELVEIAELLIRMEREERHGE